MRLDKQITQDHEIKDANKSAATYFWVFGIIDLKTKAAKRQIRKQYVGKVDPGAVGFTSSFSHEYSTQWVNKLLLGN